MRSTAVAGKIHHTKSKMPTDSRSESDLDFARIGTILDQLHEGEWWLIHMNGDVDWLCRRVLQLQAELEKRGAA